MEKVKNISQILILSFLLILVYIYVFNVPIEVNGSSMEETLQSGDKGFSRRNWSFLPSPEIERGTLVVYRDENNIFMIKRVIAISEDEIEIKNNDVYVNDEKIKEEYVVGETNKKGLETSLTLEYGYFFVMGDNRENSEDSRNQGLVHKDDIVGIGFTSNEDTNVFLIPFLRLLQGGLFWNY